MDASGEHITQGRFLWRRTSAEVCVVLVLLCWSYFEALHYLRNTAQRAPYLLNYYAPAVMVATGNGYQNVDFRKAPAVEEFLRLSRTELRPEDLPDPMPTSELTAFQEIHRTSMTLMGWWWRVFGIRWHALDSLHAMLFAISCGFAYGLFRSVAPLPVAVALTFAVLYSPGFHYILPQFRDFSKAPFVLGTLCLCAHLIRARPRPGRMVALALLLGVLLGAGLGFRQDLRVYVPMALVVLILFLPGSIHKTWARRAIAAAVLLVGFLLCASPILPDLRGATNSTHIIALGLAEPFNQRLHVGDVPYAFGNKYNDFYFHTRIAGHTRRVTGDAPPPYWTRENDEAGARFLSTFYRLFPADTLLRAYAAAWEIANHGPFLMEKFYPTDDWTLHLFDQRYRWLGFLDGLGVPLALLACVALAAVEFRLGLAAAFVLLCVCGYPSLQFHSRHYFMLEVVPLWALGCCIGLAWQLRGASTRAAIRDAWRPAFLRVAALTALCTAGLGGMYGVAYAVQSQRVGQLYADYAALPRTALTPQRDAARPNDIDVSDLFAPQATEKRGFRVREALLAIEYAEAATPFAVELRYAADTSEKRIYGTLIAPGTEGVGTAWLYVPVADVEDGYWGKGASTFLGFTVRSGDPQRVRGVYRVEDTQNLPVLMALYLPGERSTLARHMRWGTSTEAGELRAQRAFGSNLLPNGDFEEINPDGALPLGVLAPESGSRVTLESEFTAEGRHAVRQVWAAAPQEEELTQSFAVYCEQFPQSGNFDFFVRCWNQTGSELRVRLLQATSGADGRTYAEEIPRARLSIPPANGYMEYGVSVSIAPPAGANRAIIVQTLGNPNFRGGETALWDAFRISPSAMPERSASRLSFE